MEGLSTAGQLALAFAVFGVMITTGMAIELDDLRRLLRRPRAVVVGLSSQLVLLPAGGFLIAWLMPVEGVAEIGGASVQLGPLFAAGIVLLASTPGGAGSNFIIHAVDGDRALSVSLTALSSLLAFVTIPVYSMIAFDLFLTGQEGGIVVPVASMIRNVAILTVIPVAIGMGIRHRSRAFAQRAEGPSKIAAAVVVGFIIVGVVVDSWEIISTYFDDLAPAMFALNVLALALGLAAARLAGLTRRESLAISVETGVQNSPLAITLALTVLNEPAMSVPAGLFGLTMLVTASVVAGVGRGWVARDRSSLLPTTPVGGPSPSVAGNDPV